MSVKGSKKELAFCMAQSSAGVMCSWLKVKCRGRIMGVREKH